MFLERFIGHGYRLLQQFGGDGMSGPRDIRMMVLLLAGAMAAYVTYRHPAAGQPVTVGGLVVTVLYMLMNDDGN
ncbi:hypothetical protein E6R18_27935 [Streptomyces sp. A1277]|uniref:hypothetical protein n=1 Tax=Streptomyces sp. A1277 TaxID=2563103 RepID=UPI0010A20DCB|nr:hypothetical protein [Streptomyces sp. A1277]THA28399.1 hypothetical protein E6R18_27935 [Streptomyces sp. A1277]